MHLTSRDIRDDHRSAAPPDLLSGVAALVAGSGGSRPIGGVYQHTAQRVDRFLVDLGLDRLPRAHHVTVVADLTLPVAAGTARHACDAARPWAAYGWTDPEEAAPDGDRWRVAWRHEYEM